MEVREACHGGVRRWGGEANREVKR
jgi:hypothetical protein